MQELDTTLASSEQIESALGERIEAIRLQRNMTQQRLAEEAGISRSTVTRLGQAGKGISLDSFIRILKALQLADNLKTLLPEPDISPLDMLEHEDRPMRQRARQSSKAQKRWTWDDDSAGES